ncbi:Uncharacterised protein [Faecalicoccus pleomorphus]|uniref:Uncharacterized protein n=3 Tax=Faecalicoccus pleomorphus TaxID=1323 RepID=A0A380LKI4_9FIRM|nr:hypothetical protein [Faecalicoccus pleomorphus]SUO04339.1 Uncharacterised protein [Faecalicoccus pleomorphus]
MDDHLILNGAFFLKILLVAVLLILSLLIKNISMKRNWQHKKLLLFLNPLIFGFMACDIFNSGIDKTEFFSFQFYGVLTMIILLIPALWIDYKWFNSKSEDS